MKNKVTLAACVILLIAGVATLAIIRNRQEQPESGIQTGSLDTRSNSAEFGSGSAKDDTATSNRARTRDGVEHPELVAKYGESHVKYAKTIFSDITSLFDNALVIGETMSSNETAETVITGLLGGRSSLRTGLGGGLYNDLQLSEDQLQRAGAIYTSYLERKMETSKQTLKNLKKDPAPLMELMLAGDAKARGKMSEEEYEQLMAATSPKLAGVVNPLNERSMRGGNPLTDPAFIDEFGSILSEEQSGKLLAAAGESATRNAGVVEEGNITQLPAMDLEELDTTITSVSQITTGVKSMVDGIGLLQEIRPRRQPQGK